MQILEIYCQAIKRTFANFYGVARDQVEVSWSTDGGNITVRCADKIFTHGTIHDDDDETLEFVAEDEDPVTVRFSAEERRHSNGMLWIDLMDTNRRWRNGSPSTT